MAFKKLSKARKKAAKHEIEFCTKNVHLSTSLNLHSRQEEQLPFDDTVRLIRKKSLCDIVGGTYLWSLFVAATRCCRYIMLLHNSLYLMPLHKSPYIMPLLSLRLASAVATCGRLRLFLHEPAADHIGLLSFRFVCHNPATVLNGLVYNVFLRLIFQFECFTTRLRLVPLKSVY